ncbi:MAG: isochorismatase family cysteine hydrolase [Cyanobacteria bacterium J06649_11]
MLPETTALILVGYQKDYFDPDGLLYSTVEETFNVTHILQNTYQLIKGLPRSTTVVATPINFTPDYSELVNPVGVLKRIRDLGALQAGSIGSQPLAELEEFSDEIVVLPGKRGFNAFAHTNLDVILRERNITHVLVAGAITSLCIDSTGRAAHELGYRVSIISDCTAARTNFEQQFYCETVFPAYADVLMSTDVLSQFAVEV